MYRVANGWGEYILVTVMIAADPHRLRAADPGMPWGIRLASSPLLRWVLGVRDCRTSDRTVASVIASGRRLAAADQGAEGSPEGQQGDCADDLPNQDHPVNVQRRPPADFVTLDDKGADRPGR
jgi:hypothetical protein